MQSVKVEYASLALGINHGGLEVVAGGVASSLLGVLCSSWCSTAPLTSGNTASVSDENDPSCHGFGGL